MMDDTMTPLSIALSIDTRLAAAGLATLTSDQRKTLRTARPDAVDLLEKLHAAGMVPTQHVATYCAETLHAVDIAATAFDTLAESLPADDVAAILRGRPADDLCDFNQYLIDTLADKLCRPVDTESEADWRILATAGAVAADDPAALLERVQADAEMESASFGPDDQTAGARMACARVLRIKLIRDLAGI